MVGWVGLVDVEILAVGLEDRESPRTVVVVPDGYAGDDGLAATDDVPSGRVEVHEGAQ